MTDNERRQVVAMLQEAADMFDYENRPKAAARARELAIKVEVEIGQMSP